MVSIIVAVAENGVIGDKNSLLWHISEDLRYFKSVTSGHPVIMGRKTYESLGRPLPNRTNVVVTRQQLKIPGCEVAHSLEEAVAMFPAAEEVFIIGGAQIYAQALSLADRIYLTRVFHAYRGDTHFPGWNSLQDELAGTGKISAAVSTALFGMASVLVPGIVPINVGETADRAVSDAADAAGAAGAAGAADTAHGACGAWRLTRSESFASGADYPYPFAFETYERQRN